MTEKEIIEFLDKAPLTSLGKLLEYIGNTDWEGGWENEDRETTWYHYEKENYNIFISFDFWSGNLCIQAYESFKPEFYYQEYKLKFEKVVYEND